MQRMIYSSILLIIPLHFLFAGAAGRNGSTVHGPRGAVGNFNNGGFNNGQQGFGFGGQGFGGGGFGGGGFGGGGFGGGGFGGGGFGGGGFGGGGFGGGGFGGGGGGGAQYKKNDGVEKINELGATAVKEAKELGKEAISNTEKLNSSFSSAVEKVSTPDKTSEQIAEIRKEQELIAQRVQDDGPSIGSATIDDTIKTIKEIGKIREQTLEAVRIGLTAPAVTPRTQTESVAQSLQGLPSNRSRNPLAEAMGAKDPKNDTTSFINSGNNQQASGGIGPLHNGQRGFSGESKAYNPPSLSRGTH